MLEYIKNKEIIMSKIKENVEKSNRQFKEYRNKQHPQSGPSLYTRESGWKHRIYRIIDKDSRKWCINKKR